MNNNVKIFASTIEDEAYQQIKRISGVYDSEQIRIMPDVHAGKGCTIGTTILLKDKVTPNMVGVDIGCGMLCVELGNIDIDLHKLDEVINGYIPSGFSIYDEQKGIIDEDYINNNFICSSYIDIKRAVLSVGTLGGGNHFIEIDKDESGCKYLIIHTGSRHLGIDVCKYYQDIAVKAMSNRSEEVNRIIEKLKKEGREKEIQDAVKHIPIKVVDKELAYLKDKNMSNYIHDMKIAQMYASSNRNLIAKIIISKMNFEYIDSFETIHNYIDTDRMILRKGAVDAQSSRNILIPMNMRDGCLVCRGKGNKDWNYSAPHGAGRLMSRSKAKENINIDEFKRSMNGIYSTSVCGSTIDESPMAYKSMNEIISCIKDTVDIVKIIKPIYNFKAK